MPRGAVRRAEHAPGQVVFVRAAACRNQTRVGNEAQRERGERPPQPTTMRSNAGIGSGYNTRRVLRGVSRGVRQACRGGSASASAAREADRPHARVAKSLTRPVRTASRGAGLWAAGVDAGCERGDLRVGSLGASGGGCTRRGPASRALWGGGAPGAALGQEQAHPAAHAGSHRDGSASSAAQCRSTSDSRANNACLCPIRVAAHAREPASRPA